VKSRWFGVLALLLVFASPVYGHEVDNYSVPFNQEYADVGPLIDAIAYRNLRHAVRNVNLQIDAARRRNAPPVEIERLQSPATITYAVRYAFPPTLSLIDDLERMLYSQEVRDMYPGLVTAYKPFSCIYDHSSFILDPRQVFKLWRSSTIRIGDIYLGTDKIGHFLCKGYINYDLFTRELAKHGDRERAMRAAINLGTSDNFFYSEKRMVGYFSSGVFSNADLTADYAGLLFYLNVTEPIELHGQTRPAMLERDENGLWRIAPHVTPDQGVLTPFISHHMDEVLNPNLHEPMMRNAIRQAVQERACRLLEWYADELGNRRNRAWFENMMRHHSTFDGVDYGHERRWDEMVTVANTCLVPFDYGDDLQARSPRGWTALHAAAAEGDVQRIGTLIEAGADVNAVVQSQETWSSQWGDTPLHLAAMEGHIEAVGLLLRAGAEVNAANVHGATPLHRAAVHPQVAEMLLQAGAKVDVADNCGRTPLHWAAGYGNAATTTLLLNYKANVNARDHQDRTPLHYAAMFGRGDVADLLITQGADPAATADLGVTALHIAVRRNHHDVVKRLLAAGADASAPDEFGSTPLHDAASFNRVAIAATLLTHNAHVAARDTFGSTPLHEAARQGHERLVSLLLQHGAKVSDRNNAERTALHEAAARGHQTIVTLLAEHGGDMNARDRSGKTPAQLAASAPISVVEKFGRLGKYR